MPKQGGHIDVTLLRPKQWLLAHLNDPRYLVHPEEDGKSLRRLIGSTVELDLHEMGAIGSARIEDIRPCPDVLPPSFPDHHVVTGVFRHSLASVREIEIEGESRAIVVTDNHLFWSEDHSEFLPISEFEIGDRLLRADGHVAKLTRSTPKTGPPTEVFNLEIDVVHTYFVGHSGILVHNHYYGDEVVYALYNDIGEIVYYGITSHPARRLGEHLSSSKTFSYMRVLTDGLNHDLARTLEGGLIRGALEAAHETKVVGRVVAALKGARLQNMNQGRIIERWRESNLHPAGQFTTIPGRLWDFVTYNGQKYYTPKDFE